LILPFPWLQITGEWDDSLPVTISHPSVFAVARVSHPFFLLDSHKRIAKSEGLQKESSKGDFL
jgi:hypothetical protein